MRDMFYNYDHNIRTPDPTLPVWNKTNRLTKSTAVEKLINAVGDELGVTAKQNSKFLLYFNFSMYSDLDFYGSLKDNLYFDILDFKYEKIASFDVNWTNYSDEACVEIVSSEEGPLKYGVYRMHLYAVIDGQIYTLFSPEDGVLNIR